MRPRTILAMMLLVLFMGLCGVANARDIPAELARSLREAPSLESLGSGQGLVLLRDISYRLLADGRMERTTLWFIHEEKGLPDSWRKWEVVVPEGGEASVAEAGLYDPGSGKIQYPLIPRETSRDGASLIEVRVPNSLDGNIFVLSYRQVFPTRMNIEDSVLVDLDIPQWEQRITLKVPSGTLPEWSGEGIPDPQVEKGSSTDSYSWSIVNTLARENGTLSAEPGRVLVLSLRKGLRYSLAEAMSVADSIGVSPPSQVVSMLSDQNRTRGGERVIDFVNDPSLIIRGLPEILARPVELIPAEGPWTEWEAAFLLANWLKKADWGADILWEARTTLRDDSPATITSLRKPVLALTPPGGKQFMFEIGQGVKPGQVPPRLWGRTLYSLDGNTVLRRQIPAGGPADHRLSFNWKLGLSPEGFAEGDLVINVRGAWVDTISAGNLPDEKQALDMLMAFGWPSTPGMPGGEAVVEPAGSGFRITLPVRAQMGIPSGEGLLMRMPSALMPWQMIIAEKGVSGGIRFPFVYEQSIEIELPEGFEVMVLPVLRPVEAGSVKTGESLRVKKGRTLVGEQKVVISSARMDDQTRQVFANSIRQGLGWSGITVPMRKR
ncbi:MAG TPA: hypothetical protein P5541_00345 [Thermovirgaceae bacterium]|nr:hypothetical protein [Thermovirgaceae bacterium]